MVLGELGHKLTNAINSMSSVTVVDQTVVDTLIKEVCRALIESDVDVKLVRGLRDKIKKSIDFESEATGINKRKVLLRAVFDSLVELVDPGIEAWKPAKNKTNVIMFVGLQGSGKTTTCAKLAAYYKRKGYRCALVCCDTYRAGALEQLKANAKRCKVPFYGNALEIDPAVVASEGVEYFTKERMQVIIVDTSGRHKQEAALFEEMTEIAHAIKPNHTIFVLDGQIGQSARDQAAAFQSTVTVGSVILTKMDGHAKGGGALSAVAATQSPIVFIGTGEHIDCLEEFRPRSFVSKLIGKGDLEGLSNMVKDLKLEDKKELMAHLSKGIFTLRDMYEQFQTISQMGPIGNVMGMIPGLGADFLGRDGEEASTKRLKQFQVMMDSMTDEELDSDGKMFTANATRTVRVARGAGVHPSLVEMLLSQYKKFAQVVKTMGGVKGLLTGDMTRNASPQQMAKINQNMMKMMDPRMVAQMGGPGAIQNMMQQLASAGGNGMAGLKDMMGGMMGGGGGGSGRR